MWIQVELCPGVLAASQRAQREQSPPDTENPLCTEQAVVVGLPSLRVTQSYVRTHTRSALARLISLRQNLLKVLGNQR